MKRISCIKGVVVAAAVVLMMTGCAGKQSAQPPAAPIAVKPPAVMISEPYVAIQQVADKYLKENRPLFISAQDVYEKVVVGGDQRYLLVDVRSDEHYANAHIPGAIHISYADIWRENKLQHLPRDKKIVVICYSGHTASQTAAFWGLLGFDTITMQNGMAGWTKDKDAIGASPLACAPNDFPVVAGYTPAGEFKAPTLTVKASTAAEIMIKQAATIVNQPVVIQPKELQDKLGTNSYFVIDVRNAEHYQKGHIQGAINIPFRQLAESVNLKKVPTDKQVVVVCYDGHAASQAARILNLAGYHATALKDGMSVWTNNESVIGGRAIACNLVEQPVARLNAAIKPGGSAPAT